MKVDVAAKFVGFTQQFEGLCTWPYLDVKGLVTIGYGNLIEKDGAPNIPAVLQWQDLHGTPATGAMILHEWQEIKSLQQFRFQGGGEFANYAKLRVTQASIDALVIQQQVSNESILRGFFPDFDCYPADAQLGILSMAWALGAHFPPSWPHFKAAALDSDWLTCATECKISTYGNPGVEKRDLANFALFSAAYSTKTPELVSATKYT